MILFTLRCVHGHEFEAWFRDGDGFEAQQKAGEIACPECGDTSVEKAVMAPTSRPLPPACRRSLPAQFRAALVEMRRQIETNCDYVGQPLCRGGAAHPLWRDRSAQHLRRGERRGVAGTRR